MEDFKIMAIIKKIYNEGYCMGWADKTRKIDFCNCVSNEFMRIMTEHIKSNLYKKENSKIEKLACVRRVDNLGRIGIPREIREKFDCEKNQYFEIYAQEDKIILQKYIPD